MSISIRNPKKPKKPKRKFKLDSKTWKTLEHREREWFRTLSYEDKVKLNDLYARVVMNAESLHMVPCKHEDTISLKLPLKNGFIHKTEQCSKCRKVLMKTIYKDKGFGCPLPNPKNV